MTKRENGEDWAQVLRDLAETVKARRDADPRQSYTAKLLQGDEDALLKKIIEEAGEAALAAKGGGERLAEEIADLWFHCLVVMLRYNVDLSDVAAALARRRDISGLAEKASRSE